MSEPNAQNAVLRDRLLQVVAYLDDVVSRSEAPVRMLTGDRTVRGVVVPEGLPGCELYVGESWLRVAKVREPASIAVPAVLDPLVHAVRHDPDHEPDLMPDWERRAEESGLTAAQVQAAHVTWLDAPTGALRR